MERPPLVKASAISKLYGVSRNTITEWVKRGCPHIDVRTPGTHRPQRRYDIDQVQLWLDQNEIGRWEASHKIDRFPAQLKESDGEEEAHPRGEEEG
jgi:phage terminase Nu1 subunit (DNA packaging protein)